VNPRIGRGSRSSKRADSAASNVQFDETTKRAPGGGLRRWRPLLAVVPVLTACAGEETNAHAAPAPAKSSPSPDPASTNPTFPVANPSAKVDDASQHKADTWLAGAVVPSGAVKSSTQPAGVASGATPEMWCQPMADAVGYWTLPSMRADDTLTWLRSHASQGMKVTGGSDNLESGNITIGGGSVVDEPAPVSLEALIFTVTSIGSGSGIRADAFTKAANSVCATAPPGTDLGIGG
jgi:hypothetical protein